MELCVLCNCSHLCQNISNFDHCEGNHLCVCISDCLYLCSNLHHDHYPDCIAGLVGNLRHLDHSSPESSHDVSDQDWISARSADCCTRLRYSDTCTPLVTETSGWSEVTGKFLREARASCSSFLVTSCPATWAPGCAHAHSCSVLAEEEETETRGWSQR